MVRATSATSSRKEHVMAHKADPILDLATIEHHLSRHHAEVQTLATHEPNAERATDLYQTSKLLLAIIGLVGLAREAYCPFDAE